jgi:hypothetical protein
MRWSYLDADNASPIVRRPHRVEQFGVEPKSESVRARFSEPTSAGSDELSNLQLATMAVAAALTAANLYYCRRS